MVTRCLAGGVRGKAAAILMASLSPVVQRTRAWVKSRDTALTPREGWVASGSCWQIDGGGRVPDLTERVISRVRDGEQTTEPGRVDDG